MVDAAGEVSALLPAGSFGWTATYNDTQIASGEFTVEPCPPVQAAGGQCVNDGPYLGYSVEADLTEPAAADVTVELLSNGSVIATTTTGCRRLLLVHRPAGR